MSIITFDAANDVVERNNVMGGSINYGDLESGKLQIGYINEDETGNSSLVAFWPTDRSSSPLIDHSPNANDLNVQNVVFDESGVFNRTTVSFNGETSKGVAPDVSGFNPPPITVSTWVFVGGTSSPQSIISKPNWSLKEYDGNYIFEVIGDGQRAWNDITPGGANWGTKPDNPGLTVYEEELYITMENEVHKYDGSGWTQVADSSNLGGGNPIPRGMASYNGDLYVTESNEQRVLKFDGTSWTVSTTLPSGVWGITTLGNDLFVITQNGELFLFNGSSWTQVGQTSGNVDQPALCEYQGDIYIADNDGGTIYVYDGVDIGVSGTVGTNPNSFGVYDGDLYVASEGADEVSVFDGSGWSKSGDVGTNPSGLAVYDGELYVQAESFVWKFDGSSWTEDSQKTDSGDSSSLAVYDGQLHLAQLHSGSSDVVQEYGQGHSVWGDSESGFDHVSATVDTSDIVLYVNGIQEDSVSHSLNISGRSTNLRVGHGWGSSMSGRYGGNSEFFRGRIDEVRIYNRFHSSSEVSDLDLTSTTNTLKFDDREFDNEVDPETLQLSNPEFVVPADTTLKAVVHRTDGSNGIIETSDEIDFSSANFPVDVTGILNEGQFFSIEFTEMNTSSAVKTSVFEELDLTADVAELENVRLVVTNVGREWLAQETAGIDDTDGLTYFKMGEGGFVESIDGKRPAQPSITRTELVAEQDPNLFSYQKSFSEVDSEILGDALSVNMDNPSAPILEVVAFLDFDEANITPDGDNPEFWEIGLYNSNDELYAYGTFPVEQKTSNIQLRKNIFIQF